MLVVTPCAAGCAGNGEGLDQNGQPISPGGSSGGPVTADFQSIQDNVFTPICSKCHIGASAPEGLQLDAAHSYNLLVGVPSAERPDLLRVNPGNPDISYMVLKIEGASGIVGAQMPFGETPLPQATIDAIRQWITNGAPKAAAASAASMVMFAVQDHGAARFGHRQDPGEANRRRILARARRIARQRDDGPPCTSRQPSRAQTMAPPRPLSRPSCRSPLDSRRRIPPSC